MRSLYSGEILFFLLIFLVGCVSPVYTVKLEKGDYDLLSRVSETAFSRIPVNANIQFSRGLEGFTITVDASGFLSGERYTFEIGQPLASALREAVDQVFMRADPSTPAEKIRQISIEFFLERASMDYHPGHDQVTADLEVKGVMKNLQGAVIMEKVFSTTARTPLQRRSTLEPMAISIAIHEIAQNFMKELSKAENRTIIVARASSLTPDVAIAPLQRDEPSDVDILPSIKKKVRKNSTALIIGVETYIGLPRVDFAHRDAEVVEEYATNLLGYEKVKKLVNERATKSALEAHFETWLPKNVEEGGSVFIYYSGHGSPDPTTGKPYMIPYDGDPNFLQDTAYPLQRLFNFLARLEREKHLKEIIVVMDSCFSGAGGRSVLAKGIRPMITTIEDPTAASEGIVVLSATSGAQISTFYPEKRHGLFTYFFLKGLQGTADLNKNGTVEVGEIFTYLKPEVEKVARRMNQEQSPEMRLPLAKQDELSRLPLVEISK